MQSNTQYSVQVKSICGGGTDSSDWSAPFEFTTLNDCKPPTDLNVTNVTGTTTTLTWSLPLSTPVNFQVWYRPAGTSKWTARKISPTNTTVTLKNLLLNTEYKWKMRSLCTDDTSHWTTGTNFTTAASFASTGKTTISSAKGSFEFKAVVMPNPNTGNFVIQMQLPKDKATTTIELFNALGQKIWQEDLGIVSGSISKNVYLENKLPSGVYVLMIKRNYARYSIKIVISK